MAYTIITPVHYIKHDIFESFVIHKMTFVP